VKRDRGNVVAAVCGMLVLGGASAARPVPAAPAADPLRLAVEGASSSGVSLAASGRDVVATWAATAPGVTDVYTAVSHDDGASFGPATRVNDIPGDARTSGEQGPRAAIANGLDVVWCSKAGTGARIRAARSRAGAATFAPAITVHAENLPGARGWASLARDADGNAHVVWLDGRSAGDGAAMAHGMRQDIFHAIWRPDGSHEEVAVATDVCFCCKTAVATAPGGVVYVAWRHIYPTNLRDIAVAHSSDGGKTFSAPVRVSEDGWQIAGCPDDGPALAVDAAGVLHVVWPTVVAGARAVKGIFYSFSTDGGRTFAPRQRIDEEGGGAAHPQIAPGAGRVAVVWDEAGTSRRACLREVSSDRKVTASTPVLGPIKVLSVGPAVYPAIAATPSALVAAWTETLSTGSEIRVRRLPRD
jgi:hypothetical protein